MLAPQSQSHVFFFEGNKDLQVGGFVDCILPPIWAWVEKNPRKLGREGQLEK